MLKEKKLSLLVRSSSSSIFLFIKNYWNPSNLFNLHVVTSRCSFTSERSEKITSERKKQQRRKNWREICASKECFVPKCRLDFMRTYQHQHSAWAEPYAMHMQRRSATANTTRAYIADYFLFSLSIDGLLAELGWLAGCLLAHFGTVLPILSYWEPFIVSYSHFTTLCSSQRMRHCFNVTYIEVEHISYLYACLYVSHAVHTVVAAVDAVMQSSKLKKKKNERLP